MSKLILCLFATLLPLQSLFAADPKHMAPADAASAGTTNYSLFEGIVKFSAPSEWPVILEKKEGVPQFIAFQIRDPAAESGGESSEVSIDAKLLNDASTSQALFNAATDRAKQLPGYEPRNDGTDPGVLRYSAMNGKQRYEYRETWGLTTKVFVHVRCSRPVLAATTTAWTAAYEAGCARIMQTLKQR